MTPQAEAALKELERFKRKAITALDRAQQQVEQGLRDVREINRALDEAEQRREP